MANDVSYRFELRPEGPYSLEQSVKFLEGFTPAAYEGNEAGHLHLAFVPDGGEKAVGVCARSGGGVVVIEVFGEEMCPQAVRAQVARILSLDVDGSGFAAVGRRDAVVGRLQERYPGLRPVLFNSPYEAAAWAIIGNRIRIVQAAKVKTRMAQELGETVSVHGEPVQAFPSPERLLQLESFPGLSERKVRYLRGVARAAAGGRLDAARLRSLLVDEALRELKEIPGIGDFSAGLILLRGAGEPDCLPTREPRLGRAAALAYGLDEPPTAEELGRMAENWRPYRTWVALLLRVVLEEETAEISGGPWSG